MAGRILIADDVVTNRIVLKVKLAAAQYRVAQCDTAREARAIARADETDLIILAPTLPDMEGAALCRILKSDPATAALPLLMLLERDDDARRMAALSAGADEVMSIPFSEIRLLARVRSLMRAHDTDRELQRREATAREMGFAEPAPTLMRPGTVALIGAVPEQAMAWRTALRGKTPHTITLMSRSKAMQLTKAAPCPDVFVIAANMNGREDGVRLLSELRSRSATRHSATVMIHPPNTDESQANALDIGANALLEDGFNPAELALRIDRQILRKRATDLLRNSVDAGLRMATVDPLTGLFNRRYGDHHLVALADRATHRQRSYAVLMVDIDRFKSVNDNYGHAIGDLVLKSVARVLQDNLRAIDLIARYGGEEFIVALPDATLPAARLAAERLRQRVAEMVVTLPDGSGLSVTISVGLAMGGPGSGPAHDVLGRADTALFQAKNQGRNCIAVAQSTAVDGPQSRAGLRGPLRSDRSSRLA
ncbi:diguanylate cyclase [Oceaniglobus ichthyenteri]|uniref:diguanylate cyclase n=1 Tax=Oceaniglobus ichthyenteri TaxID=2136177 RepID=UPI000D38B36F|nr:diguanylate cyclase [Oceaniglobus ichthyenteri]